jgi:hypothetical protein
MNTTILVILGICIIFIPVGITLGPQAYLRLLMIAGVVITFILVMMYAYQAIFHGD